MLNGIQLPSVSVSIFYVILHLLCFLLVSSLLMITDLVLLNFLAGLCFLPASRCMLDHSQSKPLSCISCTTLPLVLVFDCLLFGFCVLVHTFLKKLIMMHLLHVIPYTWHCLCWYVDPQYLHLLPFLLLLSPSLALVTFWSYLIFS